MSQISTCQKLKSRRDGESFVPGEEDVREMRLGKVTEYAVFGKESHGDLKQWHYSTVGAVGFLPFLPVLQKQTLCISSSLTVCYFQTVAIEECKGKCLP